MSIAQEFAEDIERRRRQLARARFWFKARRVWNADRGFWIFVLAMVVLIAVLMNP